MQTVVARPELLWFVFAYFAVMVAVGIYSSKKIDSGDDYALAGRSLGPIVLMGTLMATSVGSGAVTGGSNSLGYNFGYWSGIMWIVPYCVAAPFYYFLQHRIRTSGAYTVPEILGKHYGRETVLLGSIINLIGLAGIISYQYRGLGIVLNLTTGLSVETATIIATAVIVLIAIFGGLFSVAYTDALGAFLIVGGCVIGLPYVIKAGGGWESITNTIAASAPHKLTFSGGRSFFAVVGSYLPLIILLLGDQNFYQRISAAKSESVAKTATIGWPILCILSIPCIGVAAFTAYAVFGTNIQPGMAFLSMTTIMPLFIGGILLAAASAFIVTTGTSYLLSSATSITFDFYKHYINHDITDKQVLNITRWATPVVGIAAYVILQFFPTILAIQNWSYTMIGASLTPAVLGALMTSKVTRAGGFASMATGAIVTIVWEISGLPYGLATALVAFPASVAMLIIVSALTQSAKEVK